MNRGGSGGGHRDPYANKNPYKANDPWAHKDPYATKSPWENRNVWKREDPWEDDIRERKVVCGFWFGVKLKLQEIFSSDSGAQAEGRVFSTDTDPFILNFFAKVSMKGIANLFLVPFFMILIFVGSIYATKELMMIILFVEWIIIAFLLYCPGWQVFSSGQYAITSTGEEFFKKLVYGYRGYESVTLFGFIVSTLIIGALAKYRFPFEYVYDYFNFTVPPEADFIRATLWVVMASVLYLSIYFALMLYIRKKDRELYEENKRTNIDLRSETIVGQLSKYLDE